VTGTVGTIARPEGTTQVTYNGHPLYLFTGDSAAGQTNGQGVVAFGGTWTVVQVAAAPAVTATPTATAAASGPMVLVANNPTLGPILVSSNGLTLYYNTAEKGTTLVCTAACLGFWPPLLLPPGVTTPTSGPGITGTLRSIARPDGGQQVTYNNEPLYNFSKDKNPGDINGEGIVAFGGVWHAARVNGTPLAARLAVPLTIRVTTTGSTVWGKVSVRYTVAGHRFRRACSSSACGFAVPSGATVHLTQTATNSATWPFKEWKVALVGSHRAQLLMSTTVALKLPEGGKITAVYVLHG
jgi:predicted lipoprotein with Yx(FWY)xxD motif